MFNNIGNKVKGLAVFVCWVGIIVSVIFGIVTMTRSTHYYSTIWLGIETIIVGALASWIGSWALYAIGSAACDAEESRALNAEILGILKSGQPKEAGDTIGTTSTVSNSRLSLSSIASKSTPGQPWKCQKCKAENPGSAIYCQGCGDAK